MHQYPSPTRFGRLAPAVAAVCAALALVAPPNAPAVPTETVLYAFTAGSDGGAYPTAGLILDGAGNLYGTTVLGGTGNNGVAFKLAPNGAGGYTETVLHAFTGGSDGADPQGGLILDGAGNLYGTTVLGGDPSFNLGTVFKLAPNGAGGYTETVLHAFTGGSDGAYPRAGLILDGAGNLYGTTAHGGAPANLGTAFKLAPNGAGGYTETVLYAFTGGASDGGDLEAGLILDGAGNLYGTTFSGGEYYSGVVFKLAPNGAGGYTETALYAFTGGASDGGGPYVGGGGPYAGLILDGAGNLYGTTTGGGTNDRGTVFKLAPNGSGGYTETVLHAFTGGASDGTDPQASLILDAAGNLYGTTNAGGAADAGVVFKLAPNGAGGYTETALHAFTAGASDGAGPQAGLIADRAGNLYGTTSGGGAGEWGTAFKLAGTGFVTTTPFSAFQATLAIRFGKQPHTDAFELEAKFTLGQGSNGIDPPTEALSLQVGPFSVTLPPGSFKATGFGAFYFGGLVQGVHVGLGIVPAGPAQYAFGAAALGANLSGLATPVPVSLTIGDDGGTVAVQPWIFHPRP